MLSIYLLVGLVAGTLSGLFGIGGGIIVIPALTSLFIYENTIPASIIMQMAIGTSLAIMIATSSSALYAHHRHQSVQWFFFKKMLPGLIFGAILGSLIAQHVSSQVLQRFFGIFLLSMSVYLIFKKTIVAKKTVSTRTICLIAFLIGLLSSLLGVGGGVLLIPFLLYCQLSMKEAVGTSVACGLTIGIIATLSFLAAGLWTYLPVPLSTGYIYWPAFFSIAVMSMVFAPFGAKLAHLLPQQWLKRAFGGLLLMLALKMLVF